MAGNHGHLHTKVSNEPEWLTHNRNIMNNSSGEHTHSSTSDRDRTEDVADGIDNPEPVSVPMHQERAQSLGDIILPEPS